MNLLTPPPVRLRARNLGLLILAILAVCVSLALCAQAAFGEDSTSTVTTTPTRGGSDIASGTQEGITWTIDANGVLTIEPTDGVSGEYGTNLRPWESYRSQVKEIVVKGTVIAPESMNDMFSSMPALQKADLRGFDTSNTKNMAYLFGGTGTTTTCPRLQTVNMSGLDTSKVESFSSMFLRCGDLKSVDLTGISTESATNLNAMFCYCYDLENLDVSGFNTSKVTDMSTMFANCESLTSLDLSNFDTSHVTSFASMFRGCIGLENLSVKNFDTSNAKSMSLMFSRCRALTSIDVSSFDTSKVESFRQMFDQCNHLQSLDLSNFDTSSSTDDIDYENMLANLVSMERLTLGPNSKIKNIAQLGASWYREDETSDDAIFGADLMDLSETGGAAGTWVLYPVTDIDFDPATYIATWTPTSGGNMYETHNREQVFAVYCLNKSKEYPTLAGYEKVPGTNENLLEEMGSNHGWEPLGSDMREAMIALFYWGPRSLSSRTQFQNYIWHFTNNYSEDAPEIMAWAEEHTYDSIPNKESYQFSFYRSPAGYQALASFYGLTEGMYGGLAIAKVNEEGQRLINAEFDVYDKDGQLVRSLFTDSSGYACIYRMDEADGLPAGTYTIREKKAPIGYAKTKDFFTFTISEDQKFVYKGKLNGEGEDLDIAFVNKELSPKEGSIVLSALKVLEGKKLEDNQFEFELYEADEEGNPVGEALHTVSNNADGSINFEPLAYLEEDIGTKTYVIKEVAGNEEYVTYDTHTELVTVTIEDAGEEALTCTASYASGKAVFTNVYEEPEPEPEPEPVEDIEVTVVKYLKDALIHEKEFSFGLYDSDGNLIDAIYTTLGSRNEEEADYSSSVSISFKDLSFDAPGTFIYTIREQTEGATEVVEGDANNQKGFETGFYKGGVKYDSKEYQVVITVSENDGKLFATVEYPDAVDGVHLENEYNEEFIIIDGFDEHPNDGYHEDEPEPEPAITDIQGKKVLKGATLKAEQFEFSLTFVKAELDKSNVGVAYKTQTVKNATDGSIVFTYEFGEPGTYTFEMAEVKGSETGITYDTSKKTIKVIVSEQGGKLAAEVQGDKDKAIFTNSYKASITASPKTPVTGTTSAKTADTNPIVPLTTFALLSFAIGILALRKVGER